ncbi:hypothetical protein VIGAN_11207800 [Vigna angularis var. angularis]|uniref:Uncharacterized protein n=1 Tax=Vigna angularis var. angularis TaxID=157739 RepID=A0A0S3TBI4_PHAAN|nr:hypothetical protein VIGAN_11207800 [Vigna angularis var. angularis]
MAVRIDERKVGIGTSFSPLRSVPDAGNSPKLRGSPEKKERPLKFSLMLVEGVTLTSFSDKVGGSGDKVGGDEIRVRRES